MDRLYRTTGWGCAWGSMSGSIIGGIFDLFIGTSGLLAFLLAGFGAVLGSHVGFRVGSKDIENAICHLTSPLDIVKIHKQHGAMWSLMGAMVGGVVGATVGTGVAAAGWVLYMHHMEMHMPNTMDFMSIFNVVMGGEMGGMTAGVIGAWWSAARAGFVGAKKDAQLPPSEKRNFEA
ncbi:hypothetical protein [Alicyclobacillus kakegawensis]|uniref:hypothetical protein n=1 Tax=Alicyclobacillus kakegawensis TaxID=392012 RepID=UPI000B0D16EC|nr:hypothetical protein [Alicyclobacillus kakegawensis]